MPIPSDAFRSPAAIPCHSVPSRSCPVPCRRADPSHSRPRPSLPLPPLPCHPIPSRPVHFIAAYPLHYFPFRPSPLPPLTAHPILPARLPSLPRHCRHYRPSHISRSSFTTASGTGRSPFSHLRHVRTLTSHMRAARAADSPYRSRSACSIDRSALTTITRPLLPAQQPAGAGRRCRR